MDRLERERSAVEEKGKPISAPRTDLALRLLEESQRVPGEEVIPTLFFMVKSRSPIEDIKTDMLTDPVEGMFKTRTLVTTSEARAWLYALLKLAGDCRTVEKKGIAFSIPEPTLPQTELEDVQVDPWAPV